VVELEKKKYVLLAAYNLAKESPDPSTQNGAIILGSSWRDVELENRLQIFIKGKACNTFPKAVKSSPERLQRPLKYDLIEHAERRAIYDAAFNGVPLQGTTMFVPYFACAACARAIICSGIKEVIGHQEMMNKTPAHWKKSIEIALIMLEEAGIKTELVLGQLDGPELLFNGSVWKP
jgi:dCMP deaminase